MTFNLHFVVFFLFGSFLFRSDLCNPTLTGLYKLFPSLKEKRSWVVRLGVIFPYDPTVFGRWLRKKEKIWDWLLFFLNIYDPYDISQL